MILYFYSTNPRTLIDRINQHFQHHPGAVVIGLSYRRIGLITWEYKAIIENPAPPKLMLIMPIGKPISKDQRKLIIPVGSPVSKKDWKMIIPIAKPIGKRDWSLIIPISKPKKKVENDSCG